MLESVLQMIAHSNRMLERPSILNLIDSYIFLLQNTYRYVKEQISLEHNLDQDGLRTLGIVSIFVDFWVNFSQFIHENPQILTICTKKLTILTNL